MWDAAEEVGSWDDGDGLVVTMSGMTAPIFENIYLYTGGQASEVAARRVASAIGGDVTRVRGQVIVKRPMSSVPGGWVSGQVRGNLFYENPPDLADPCALDLYDISYDVWCAPQPEEFQRREAALIFADLIEKLHWPALLTHDTDLLIAGFAPRLGRRDFPEGTSSYVDSHGVWARYANPAAVAQPMPS